MDEHGALTRFAYLREPHTGLRVELRDEARRPATEQWMRGEDPSGGRHVNPREVRGARGWRSPLAGMALSPARRPGGSRPSPRPDGEQPRPGPRASQQLLDRLEVRVVVARGGPCASMASTCCSGIVARSRNSSSEIPRPEPLALLLGRHRSRLALDLPGPPLRQDAVLHLRFDRARGSAEAAEDVADELIGHGLVALTADDVGQRLPDDDLRERGDHDRVTELGPNPGHLVDHLVVPVARGRAR